MISYIRLILDISLSSFTETETFVKSGTFHIIYLEIMMLLSNNYLYLYIKGYAV